MRVRLERSIWVAALCLTTFACSGDDDDAAGCPAGADAGEELACECEDDERGVQRCGADDTLGECDCSGESGGESGRGSSGTGGRDASTGSGGRSGEGGEGGSDAGVPPDEDDDAGTEPGMTQDGGQLADGGGSTLPDDGDQLAVCEDDDDCEGDLACYDEGPGQHFCTQPCEEPADCMDLAGAEYTCSDDGLCEVECENFEDRDSCPDGLSCTMVSGPGPGGIQFRCKYSENAGQSGSGETWSACLAAGDCDDGLECVGAFGPIPGYCAQACAESAECTAEPDSGDIEPTCEQIGPMPSARACALDCSGDAEGCPDDMVCGFGSRCVY